MDARIRRVHHVQGTPLKAVLLPFRRDAAIVTFAEGVPTLLWAVVASTEELAREIGGAEILVASSRACTPAYGEVLRRHACALRWIYFSSSGIERGVAMGVPDGVRVTNSTGVKATMVAEHALMLLLALVGQLPECEAHRRGHVST